MINTLAALLVSVTASPLPPNPLVTPSPLPPNQLVAPALPASMHEIHSTLTIARVTAGALELRVRVFADDLSRVVAQSAGRSMPMDSSVRASELARYVAAHLGAFGPSGQRVLLESCGIERVREVYLLCYRTAASARSVVKLWNSMLTDLHDDQVNVVQVIAGSARRSHLLTRDAPTLAFAAPR